MRNLFLLLLIPFFATSQESKTSEIVNPDGNWYFGVEIGSNKITSYSLGESDKSFQGGVLAEYYTGRHWSLTGRIKYFKTGLSFYNKSTSTGGGFFSFGSSASYGRFEGAVISIPVNLKWEFRIWKNFSGNLNFGLNYNLETKSDYDYSENINSSYTKEYISTNVGYGFNYFISKKIGVFLNVESYLGGVKKRTDFLNFPVFNTNNMLNFGFKYNFKK